MIWRRRDRAPDTEAPLWDLLDACQIPFRAPLSDWIARYNTCPSLWSAGLDYCTPAPQTPPLPAMDVPMRAQVSEHSDLGAPPDYLWGAVRGARDHRLNYARAIAGLTKLFGKGRETSSANTVSRDWRFGLARVSCTVWPPAQQHPVENARHKLFPDTAEEASIAVHPAWRAPLSTQDAADCATAQMLWARPDADPLAYPQLTPFSHDWPDLPPLPQGIAVSDADALLVVKPRGITDVIPRARLTGLFLNRYTHGRGGAGSYLQAGYTIQQRDGPAQTRREIATSHGRPDALDALANTLADRLDLPLDIWTGDNT